MTDKEEYEKLYNEVLMQSEYEFSEPDSGIYFIYDKNRQKLVYVGIGGQRKNGRNFNIRIRMHKHNPTKTGNLGRNLKKIDDDKKDWEKSDLRDYITDNFSFRYMVIEDASKLKKFEEYMVKNHKPRYNIDKNPRYKK